MYEYRSQKDLYEGLIPAFNVKLKLLKDTEYSYITKEDIWNYLKENKWTNSVDLTLADMVQDIIHVSQIDIDIYLKNKLKNEEKKIIIS